MSGTAVGALRVVIHLMLTSTLQGRYYYYPHYKVEKIEVQ